MDIRNKSLAIANGPGKSALIDAFKYSYDDAIEINVDFVVILGYTDHPCSGNGVYKFLPMRNVRISTIKHMDNSGHSFNLEGICRANPGGSGVFTPYKFQAYYDTMNRKGTITFAT